MGAKLYITYDKRTLPDTTPAGYFMYTKVGVNTDPANLYKSLVVVRAMGGREEQIVGVATLSELASLSELPALTRFYSPALTGLEAGDTLRIYRPMPPLWETLGYTGAIVDFTIASFDETNKWATTTSVFPTQANNVTFEVLAHGGGGVRVARRSDGVADRQAIEAHDRWLTSAHYDFFLEVDDADVKYTNCQATAQSLVTAWNAGVFSGTVTELYE